MPVLGQNFNEPLLHLSITFIYIIFRNTLVGEIKPTVLGQCNIPELTYNDHIREVCCKTFVLCMYNKIRIKMNVS